MKSFKIALVFCAIFFSHAAYSEPTKIAKPCNYQACPRCGTYHQPYTPASVTTCSWESYCYWQRYCAAERSWYDTMAYPSYRRWPLLNRLSR